MPLQRIDIPDSIASLPIDDRASDLIDTANDAIEAFMLSDQSVIENFVTCDFHLVEQALDWIEQNHLSAGNRFCELGAGFGVVTMLAARRGYDAIGIEIESRLVQEATDLAQKIDSEAVIHEGSFVPPAVPNFSQIASEVRNVDTTEDNLWDHIGWGIDEVDLFFAFPWPGEQGFFEAILDARACDGSLFLTYQGREGMRLHRKI